MRSSCVLQPGTIREPAPTSSRSQRGWGHPPAKCERCPPPGASGKHRVYARVRLQPGQQLPRSPPSGGRCGSRSSPSPKLARLPCRLLGLPGGARGPIPPLHAANPPTPTPRSFPLQPSAETRGGERSNLCFVRWAWQPRTDELPAAESPPGSRPSPQGLLHQGRAENLHFKLPPRSHSLCF